MSKSRAQKEAYEHYRKQRENIFTRFFAFFRTKSSKPKASEYTDPDMVRKQRNINTAWYMLAVAIGTLGASYASVPLYKVFCQTTGFGGTTQRILQDDGAPEANMFEQLVARFISNSNILSPVTSARVHTWTVSDAAAKLAALRPVANAELITVRFDSTVSDVLPWTFEPVQLDVKIVPGETALSFFRVTNHSDKAITGVATYNVHPPKVGLYFQKIQCFCFEQQRLLPGETVDMPVFFFIDPEILNDPQVHYVRSVTLSYTFFQTDEDYDFPVNEEEDEEEVGDDDDEKSLKL